MNKPPFYQLIQEQKGGAADLYILGEIADYQLDESDTSPASLKNQIAALDAPALNVYIDSYGGSVAAGWGVYNLLRQYAKSKNATVTTHGIGFVASAALYPFMAGSIRYAHNPFSYYFHPVSTLAVGYASDLRKTAEDVDKMTEIGMAAFTENTALSADDVRELMEAETWLSPSEALAKGIATAMITDAPTAAASQSAKKTVFDILFRNPLSNKELFSPEQLSPHSYQPETPPAPLTAFQRLQRTFLTNPLPTVQTGELSAEDLCDPPESEFVF